ncbi:MAG: peptidylprolyl isomerase [Ichthyobacteriaceae bacterium]|nr:peptidylprolyl isomerase [Ichthyobacteriaceae bacterium]
MQEGLYAKFHTSKGEILVNLEFEKAPVTVANFVGLAEGAIKNTHKAAGEPYYDGIVFHRVLADFMIQGGDPSGTGSGGPGYNFDDEIHPDLRHTGPGILSMANAGPGTNGSQFFITHVGTPWLDGKHTVFGNVVEGQEIVDAIAQKDTMNKVEIIRVGKSAEAFDAVAVFAKKDEAKKEKEAAAKAEQAKELELHIAGMTQTESGLYYMMIQEGKGDTPEKGQEVSVHYKGMLLDGSVFDTSYSRNQPLEFPVGVGQVIPGWDEGIMLLNKGAKARLVIPSDLAYGAAGAGGVIPPNAALIFDVELMNIK